MVRVRGCVVRSPSDRVSNYECHSERSRRIYRPTDGKARPLTTGAFDFGSARGEK